MKILIIDTETTGLNPDRNHLLEIAAILWSVKHRCILMQVSTLIGYEQIIENPAEPINGISSQSLELTFNYKDGLKIIAKMSLFAAYICSHNAQFDRSFCRGIEELELPMNNWIDTQDLVYPKSQYIASTSLNNLAIAHRIPIVDAHRALNDCQVLVNLLALIPDLEIQLSKAARPKVLVKSLEEKPGTLSKKHGFRWNSIIPFAWAKYMPEEDISLLPFKAIRVRS
ncbi:MAG: 3'-5' exonuclease [Cyanobacteria bacterium SBLK]|nr:3'-5' exonuclease [Cyanobacteria bacterium SBLK]